MSTPDEKTPSKLLSPTKQLQATPTRPKDSSSSLPESNESEQKKRKITEDPFSRKLAKVRRNSKGTVSYPEDFYEFDTDEDDKQEEKSSPKKTVVENNSTQCNVVKNKVKDDCAENKENVDSQLPETLEDLDELFEEGWTDEKPPVNELDELFINDWDHEATIDLSKPARCIIVEIVTENKCVMLTLKDNNGAKAKLKCLGVWYNTKITHRETVVVKAKKESPEDEHWIIDNNFGWIVSKADTLISGTSVVGGLFCSRRSILQEKFRQIESLPYYESKGEYMLTGSLTHELLQTVLANNITEVKKINELLNEILVSKHAITMMYSAGVSLTECKNLMRPSVAQIYKFIHRYIKGVQPDVADQNFNGKIEKICDIEENVWLPTLGLKGKIDLTVEVSEKSKNKLFPSEKRRILPLEIKTGRATFSNEHQGQLMLYTMMMSMTGRETDTGLLLYLRENTLKEVVASKPAQRDLINLRNSVAYYLSSVPTILKEEDKEIVLPMELPEPIDHYVCSKCPYKILCCTYLSDEEKNNLYEGHQLLKVNDSVADHLSSDHIDYVKKWISLMQIEETTDKIDAPQWKDVWNLEPHVREKKGYCIGFLKIVSVTERNGRFFHEFRKTEENEKSEIEINLLDFAEEKYVIISTKSRVNVCAGYIDHVSENSIIVHCEKDIRNVYKDEIFFIDKSCSSSFLTHNLSQLGGLLDDHEICSRLRKVVIDKRPATFTKDLPPKAMEIGENILNKLNENQKQAILKALEADDYLLIKGFPGTGKTQTLVAMIDFFVKLDMSVLVTAHTNSAIDNILLKLLERKVDFIRLGSSAKAHPALIEKLDDNATANCDSPESLHTLYSSKKVVGVTCYGSTHPHLSKRQFDVCIVDESTQVLQPTILRPLYCASKFVLVGDPEQLPPIAKNNTARKLGINESLFNRLDTKNNSVSLTQQYRMNDCIMNLANKLTYHDQLQVGNQEVANATLPVTNVAPFESCEKWIQKTLSLELKNSVTMLNTSATHHLTHDSNIETKKGKTCNYWEAAIILRLVEVLKELGINSQEIGIIAPYRAQVTLLCSIISSDIEVNTVDQYQGRDKSVIIYSCAKSISKDIDIQEFDILKDQQRLTVAVTRAKHKLIIIGDVHTLDRYTPFQKLISILKNEDQIYDLLDDEDDFSFDDLIRILI